jgi:glyoxylase-like metal-dependent hydrolase (beta-lactamase superfamily II)
MSLHRRHFLQAATALAVPGTALAKAPMAGNQMLGVHRMKLGDFEVTTLLDGYIDINPALLNAPPEQVKKLFDAAEVPYGPVRTPVNTFLINTGDHLVLIDAGGARMLGPTAGRLPQALAAAGMSLDQIDEVYITHMHGDHLHGTVTPEGTPMFPNAVVRVAKADLDFWGSAEVEAAAPADQKWRYVAAKRAKAAYGDRLKPFEPGGELVPGIRSVAAVGHTPGHSCYLVTSGKAQLMLIGDLIHLPMAQFSKPEMTIAFDWQQPRAAQTRQAIFDRISDENMLLGAVHLPFPGLGQLRKHTAGAYTYLPLAWRLF